MRSIWTVIQAACIAAGGAIGWFFGGLDGFMIALIVFVAADYITGVMCGVTTHTLSSAIGFKGICRKVAIFLLVGISHVLDVTLIGSGSALRTAVICFYLSNEGISLLENSSRLGLPIPKKLKEILKQLHDKSDGKDEEQK